MFANRQSRIVLVSVFFSNTKLEISCFNDFKSQALGRVDIIPFTMSRSNIMVNIINVPFIDKIHVIKISYKK